MYFRSIVLFFFCSCITFCASAQQLFTISGVIYKKSYNERVAQANVTNASRKLSAMSDNLGVFHIKAATGDTLLFKKEGFTTEYFVISGPYDINIYMRPVIVLKEVTIKEQSRKQEINSTINDYRKKGLHFDGRPPVSTFSPFGGSPLTGLYELFGKDARNERHFKEYTKNDLDQLEINKKYNRTVVKQITNIPDGDIESFMHTFTPSVQDVREWNDYDVINYVKRSYEYFKDHKDQLKLQKLY